jgi:hypothetical protein
MPNCKKRILQVVEQTKAKTKIECAKLQQVGIFCVEFIKLNISVPQPGFLHIFCSTIDCSDLKAIRPEQLGKMPKAAANINSASKVEAALQIRNQLSDNGASCCVQFSVVIRIKNQ